MAKLSSAWLGLSIGLWSQLATGQASPDSWSLTGLKVRAVPAIWMLAGNEYVRRSPPEGEQFLEVQGRLKVPPGVRLDPVSLAEIRSRLTPDTRPSSAFTVGSSIAMCRYLPAEVRAGEASRIALGPDSSLGVSRDGPGAPLKLTVEGSSVDLCIAFATPGMVGESLSLEFGGRAFTVALADKPRQPAEASKTSLAPVRDLSLMTTRKLLMAAFFLVGAGALAMWWRRARRAFPAADSEPLAVDSLRKAPLAEAQVAAPPRISAEHCRTSFARVGANAGPGKSDFEEALRVLQVERFSEADALLAQAITKGLPAAFECGAWSLRGQAAIALGQVDCALRYFLNALGGPEVTLQAALPAAMHLAVIYRALGLRVDADKMESLAKAINGIGITIEPAAIKCLQDHTQAYRKAVRAARPSALKSLARRLFNRSTSTSAT